jgi:hypothetical protein
MVHSLCWAGKHTKNLLCTMQWPSAPASLKNRFILWKSEMLTTIKRKNTR